MFIVLVHLGLWQRPALYADFTTKSSVSDYISTSKYTLQVANGIKQMLFEKCAYPNMLNNVVWFETVSGT